VGALDDDYFHHMYRHNPDPWDFTNRWYEERKRALTMAILPRQHFTRIFEPGCSIGNLTMLLVDRCDEIIASDLVDAAVDYARARLADSDVNGKARFEKWSLRDRWPNESFDLIVLSEICFYLTAPELDDLLDSTCAHLNADGVLLAAHWRHVVTDYPMTGDAVHDRLNRHHGLRSTARYADTDVLIETFSRADTPASSVAEDEGLTSSR
jgi:SAM-dependent methyltransferase